MTVAVLCALALVAPPAPPAAPATMRQQVGVNIHFTGAPARDLDLIAQAGFGWVRTDVFWERVERQRGEYRFEAYDLLLDGLDSRGLRALLILDYANPLYETGHSVRTPAGREAFARFAAAAAQRYRGRGVRWEIWNEPNLEQYWSPQPSAPDYIELVRVTAAAIRAADPQATIVAPATSGFPWAFFDRLFEAGMVDQIDAFSVHPYRGTPPEAATRDLDRLRRTIAAHVTGERRPPALISGEWGYSTAGSGRVSEELQARYLARMFLVNAAAGVQLSIWYDWMDDGPDPAEREHRYGLIDRDRRLKPAFAAARALSSVLGDAYFVRRLDAGGDDHVLLFGGSPEGPFVLAAWTQGAAHDVVVHGFKDGALEVTDLLGKSTELRATDGRVELPLSDAPLYLRLPRGTDAAALAAHSIELLPLADRLVVGLQRSGAGTVAGRVRVSAGRRTTRRSVILDPAQATRLDLPVQWKSRRASAVSVSVVGTDGRLLASRGSQAYALPAPFRDWGGGPDTAAASLSARLDGDPGVAGTAEVSRTAPVTRDGLTLGPAVRLGYRFAPGWKFARLVADGKQQGIRGRPQALSVWVHGDGSGAALRCRFRDASGETFQQAGEAVSWTGWRRVELPLDGASAAFWGGDGDGEVDYPIVWDSLLLVDPGSAGGEGELMFASPLLVYPASRRR